MIVIPKKDQFTDIFLYTVYADVDVYRVTPVNMIVKRDFSALDTYCVGNLLRIAKFAGVPKYEELTYKELIEGIKANTTFE